MRIKMKQSLNLTIDETLVNQLRRRRINISRHVEKLLYGEALGSLENSDFQRDRKVRGSNPLRPSSPYSVLDDKYDTQNNYAHKHVLSFAESSGVF